MSGQRVAVRYANSLIELGSEKGVLEAIAADMSLFLRTCEASRELVNLLNSPVVAQERKAIILEKIFKGRISDLSFRFFALVTKKHREGVLVDIAHAFQHLYNDKKGIQIATLVSVGGLSAAHKTSITQNVKELTGRSRVQFVEKNDPELIGGFVLRVGDRQLDNSVKSKLNELKVRLITN